VQVSKEKIGYARMNKAYVCVEAESFLPLSKRKQFYNKQGFDNPLLFDEGDLGPAGGIQTMEAVILEALPCSLLLIRIQRVGLTSPVEGWELKELEGSETSC